MVDLMEITRERLGKDCGTKLEIVDSEEDLFYRMALDIYDEIEANNRAHARTVLIVPVGPVRQYRKLAMLVNRHRLSLRNTHVFNMDEYLDGSGEALSADHPLSFQGTMFREFYDLVDASLNVPPKQRHFPTPENIGGMGETMRALGGVDVCFGGIGINGHVAFNEPPEPGESVSDEEFAALPGRVLKISRETRTVNATFSTGGLIDAMPEYCVTLGMREILASRKIRLYLAREWQRGIVRKVLYGPVSARTPATLLRNHPDLRITICEAVAAQPRMQ
jgi:glucosamine-6-phosphate deaminase